MDVDGEDFTPVDPKIRGLCGKGLVLMVVEYLKCLKIKEAVCAWQSNLDYMTRANSSGSEGEENLTRPPLGPRNQANVIPSLIPRVNVSPPMSFWTETTINFPVADSTAMTHLPFFGDDELTREKQGDFEDELLELHNGKVDVDLSTPLEDDGVDLIIFIRVLMEVNEKFGNSVCEMRASKLLGVYKRVVDAGENQYNFKMPSDSLLKDVCDSLAGNMTPDQLRSRYVQLCRKRDPDFGKKIRPAPQNLDDHSVRAVVCSKPEQMNSYKSLMCRFCFVYSCPKHPALMTTEAASTYSAVAKLDRNGSRSTSLDDKDKPAICSFPNCWKKLGPEHVPQLQLVGMDPESAWRDLLAEWSAVERTMFNSTYETLEDPCAVAALIGTKSCSQVRDYHQLEQIVLERKNRWIAATPCCSTSCSSKDDCDEDAFAEYDNLQELCTFTPCFHPDGKCTDTCPCVAAKKKCESACGCLKTCKNRFRGCDCNGSCVTAKCPCYARNRECDPDLCKRCGASESVLELKLNLDTGATCKNVAIQRRQWKRVYVGRSRVSGWGAFTREQIKKGEFVIEYTGELISSDEAERRGRVYDERRHTYLFDLTNDLVLDGMYMGSKAKFMNSSAHPNCQPVSVNVRGEARLAIRALRDIPADEELFIDYQKIIQMGTENETANRPLKCIKKK